MLSRGPHVFEPLVHKVGLQLELVVHDNGDNLMARTHLSVILFICLSILVKIFPHHRRKLFGLESSLKVFLEKNKKGCFQQHFLQFSVLTLFPNTVLKKACPL